MAKRRKIVSRQTALRRGLIRYFTGKPCKRGHVAERTSKRDCVECKRLGAKSPARRKAQRRYNQSSDGRARQWRANHSPKGYERSWRYDQSPKGRAKHQRFNQSPRGLDGLWQRNHSPKGYASQWRHRHTLKYRIAHAAHTPHAESEQKRRRELRLERIQAIYDTNPSQANWNRLQNLIARRIRDGR